MPGARRRVALKRMFVQSDSLSLEVDPKYVRVQRSLLVHNEYDPFTGSVHGQNSLSVLLLSE